MQPVLLTKTGLLMRRFNPLIVFRLLSNLIPNLVKLFQGCSAPFQLTCTSTLHQVIPFRWMSTQHAGKHHCPSPAIVAVNLDTKLPTVNSASMSEPCW